MPWDAFEPLTWGVGLTPVALWFHALGMTPADWVLFFATLTLLGFGFALMLADGARV